jgi:hypothetical protein
LTVIQYVILGVSLAAAEGLYAQAQDDLAATQRELVEEKDKLGRMAEECADLQGRVEQLV